MAWCAGGWTQCVQRAGQKNSIARRCARRASRPAAPQDQRYASACIFGAVCPQGGIGAVLVLPCCDTAAMNLHLAGIGAKVEPGRHAVLLLDQAGWHMAGDLAVPDTITLPPRPPKCPELNVMENVWQFLRDNRLANRLLQNHDDIVDHYRHAWNRLIDQPRRIISVGLRDRAQRC